MAPGLNPGRGKTLVQQQTQQGSQKAELKGKIIEFLWWMRKQGYAEQTIYSRGRRLRRLVKLGANLLDPESVKEILARQKNWSKGYKETFVITYDLFAKWLGLQWSRPKCQRGEVLPWVPTEKEVDQLIAGVNKRFATFIQLLKETGMRAGEAFNLTWDQVDFETRTIRVVPEKGSNPRIFKISNKLLGMIQSLPKRGKRIFCQSSNYKNFYKEFCYQRSKVAKKLNNPRIKKISFLSLRHFKGTYEYHRTRDILHVMKVLGHKNIKNTMVYIQLEQALFKEDVEYVCRVARTIKEAKTLIEAGFEFVCEINGAKLFRKPK